MNSFRKRSCLSAALILTILSTTTQSSDTNLSLRCDGDKSSIIIDELVDGDRFFNERDVARFEFIAVQLSGDICSVRYEGGFEYRLPLVQADEFKFVCELVDKFGSGVFNDSFEYSKRTKTHRLSISRITGVAQSSTEDLKERPIEYKNLIHHSSFSNCRALKRKF